MWNSNKDLGSNHSVELKEILLQKKGSEIQKTLFILAQNGSNKSSQIADVLFDLDKKILDLEVQGADENFRRQIKEQILFCLDELISMRRQIDHIENVVVHTTPDKNLKEVHMTSQRSILIQIKDKLQIVIEKYKNIELRHINLTKFQVKQLSGGLEAESSTELQRERIRELQHEQDLLSAREQDIKDITNQYAKTIQMIKGLDTKTSEEGGGLRTSEMNSFNINSHRHSTPDSDNFTSNHANTSESSIHIKLICLIAVIIIIILYFMLGDGDGQSQETEVFEDKS